MDAPTCKRGNTPHNIKMALQKNTDQIQCTQEWVPVTDPC